MLYKQHHSVDSINISSFSTLLQKISTYTPLNKAVYRVFQKSRTPVLILRYFGECTPV